MVTGSDARHGSVPRWLVETPRTIWAYPPNKGQRARRLATWVAWQAWQRTVRRPWRVRVGDLRVTVHPHDDSSSRLLYFGSVEPEFTAFAHAWLSAAGGAFLDIGAHAGLYSLHAATVPGVQVVAFEPGATAFGWLSTNIRENGLDDRVTAVRAAVSDVAGRSFLTARRGATNRLVNGAGAEDVEDVPTVPVDDYVNEGIGRVGLMKVDVEGHEPAVLNGAADTIRRDRPALIVEFNDREVIAALSDGFGYERATYRTEDRRLERLAWADASAGNVILVPDVDAANGRLDGLSPGAGRILSCRGRPSGPSGGRRGRGAATCRAGSRSTCSPG